jgi:hypothetical protein
MTSKKPPIDKFREAAREMEGGDDERKFDNSLRRVAKKPNEPPKPAKKSGEKRVRC